MVLDLFSRFGELRFGPVFLDQQVIPDAEAFLVEAGQFLQKLGPGFAEEDADNHVDFFHFGKFFPGHEEFVQNQGDDQNLDRDESQVLEEIEKGVVGIVENLDLSQEKQDRRED